MPNDEYPAEAIRVLEGMEFPKRDPSDPVVRWAAEFLGLPPGDTGAPCSVPGVVPEPPGTSGE